MWDLEKRLLPDMDAVRAVLNGGSGGEPLDIGTALVLVHAARLDLDRAEYGLFEAGRAMGMRYEAIAAVLELPDAAAAERHRWLKERSGLPRAEVSPDTGTPGTHSEAAAQAERRASLARRRAGQAARRGHQLGRGPRGQGGPAAWRDHAEVAAAQAGEARVRASEALERVTFGLLRAANAMDRCASAYQEIAGNGASGGSEARRKAVEYHQAARKYREMAGAYQENGTPQP